MCKADLNRLVGYLKEHLDESKLFSEWYVEVNQFLPRGRRLSSGELAFAFRLIRKKNLLEVEQRNKLYCFR